jgi:hypothetical protein
MPYPTATTLSEKMQERADHDGLPNDAAMRVTATAFDKASRGYLHDPQLVGVVEFMQAWAQARRVWCKYTGEELV